MEPSEFRPANFKAFATEVVRFTLRRLSEAKTVISFDCREQFCGDVEQVCIKLKLQKEGKTSDN